jgi:hypothetical protein
LSRAISTFFFLSSCCIQAKVSIDARSFSPSSADLPDVPVRQWVLSLPHRIRLLCAYDPELCRAVRSVFVRAVSNTYLRRTRRLGLPRANTGAVVFDQRFDSAVRLDLHFHGLFADGVFSCAIGQARADFAAAEGLGRPHRSPRAPDPLRRATAHRRRTALDPARWQGGLHVPETLARWFGCCRL